MNRSDQQNTSPIPGMNSEGSLTFLILISAVAAIGGLLFGFDTAVISGANAYIKTQFELSSFMEGFFVSSVLIGCAVGALVAGTLSDRFGRKKTMILTAILFTIGGLGQAIAPELITMTVFRILCGMGIGMASMLSPMYIAEVSPPNIRGRLVSLQQLAIVSGILIAYMSNSLIAHTELVNALKWRWMLGAEVVPAVIYFILLFFVPESPRWLTQSGDSDQAFSILARIAGNKVATNEMSEIKKSLKQEKGKFSELFRPGIRMALIVGVTLAILQQFVGINTVIYYAPIIFKRTGFGSASALGATVWVGAINFLFTLVAIWLIDKIGRKALLIYGAIGMGISLFMIGLLFEMKAFSGPWILIFILVYIASFAASFGPVVWVLISEIYPNKIRGRAASTATMSNWVANFFVTLLFPVMLDALGAPISFWIFFAWCIISLIFVIIVVPETKGKSLEEIEESWMGVTPEEVQ
jgi:sugar porter (SP) family MFS transporter